MVQIFNPARKLSHKDAAVRLQFIQELDDSNAEKIQDALIEAVRADDSSEVRIAAAGRLRDTAVLGAMLESGELPNAVADAVASRIAHMIERGSGIGFADHPRVQIARLQRIGSEHPQDYTALLAPIDDTQRLCHLALHTSGAAQSAITAALHRKGESALIALESASRDHDKQLNRFARTHLEDARTARATLAQLRTRLEELREASARQRLEDAETDVERYLRSQRLRRLEQSWQEIVPQWQAADAMLQQALQGEATAMPDNPFEGLGLAAAGVDPYESLRVQLSNITRDLALSAPDEADLNTHGDTLQQIQKQWQDVAEHQPPAPADIEALERTGALLNQARTAAQALQAMPWTPFNTLALTQPGPETPQTPVLTTETLNTLRQWHNQHAQVLANLQWPAGVGESAVINERRQELDTAAALLTDWQAQIAAARTQISTLLDTVPQLLASGALEEARETLDTIRQHAELPDSTDKTQRTAIHTHFKQLKDLRDWQAFVTGPKREELCVQMEKLATEPLPPDAQAAAVKALREEWNTLGKPTNAEGHNAQRRFNGAAETAFNVCREHFQAQNTLRAENLLKRKAILEETRAFVDGIAIDAADAEIDFRQLEQQMRTSRKAWNDAVPVDGRKNRVVQTAFDAVQQRIFERLKTEWDKNLAAKEDIVKEAEALAAGEFVANQTERAKALQAQWKATGMTPRNADQKLWKRFRAACDEIFNQRQAAQSAQREAAQAVTSGAEDFLNRFEAMIEALTPASASRKDLKQWQADWQALGRLPRGTDKLTRRMHNLTDQFESLLKDKQLHRKQAELDTWKSTDIAVSEAEAGNLPLPEALEAPFNNRRSGGSIEELRDLAITAEIAAGISSPQADSQRRLELQVKLMNQGTGLRGLPSGRELAEQWCAAGPKREHCDALRERLFAAVARMR